MPAGANNTSASGRWWRNHHEETMSKRNIVKKLCYEKRDQETMKNKHDLKFPINDQQTHEKSWLRAMMKKRVMKKTHTHNTFESQIMFLGFHSLECKLQLRHLGSLRYIKTVALSSVFDNLFVAWVAWVTVVTLWRGLGKNLVNVVSSCWYLMILKHKDTNNAMHSFQIITENIAWVHCNRPDNIKLPFLSFSLFSLFVFLSFLSFL